MLRTDQFVLRAVVWIITGILLLGMGCFASLAIMYGASLVGGLTKQRRSDVTCLTDAAPDDGQHLAETNDEDQRHARS